MRLKSDTSFFYLRLTQYRLELQHFHTTHKLKSRLSIAIFLVAQIDNLLIAYVRNEFLRHSTKCNFSIRYSKNGFICQSNSQTYTIIKEKLFKLHTYMRVVIAMR